MEAMNNIYKPNVLLLYNGHNVTEDFSPYLLSITYTDYEKDQSDELNIRLRDNKGLFKDSWSLRKGDKLTCTMLPQNGEKLECGTFTIDEAEFSGDESGDICAAKALAATINKPVRTRFTRGYSGKTLVDIAKEIGSRQGFEVIGTAGFVYTDTISQVNETDLAFLRRIASMYGYCFKITDDKLTFMPIEDLENSEVLLKFSKSDIKSYSLTDTSTKMYGACTASYYDPKTKKLKSYTTRNENSSLRDTLKLSTRYASLDAAKRAAQIGLKNGSTEVIGSIALKESNGLFVAGVNIELVDDFGIYNGKYHITQSTHSISCGSYEVFGEINKIPHSSD